MAWTTPRTWVTGEVVTASIMNTHVRDNFNASPNAIATGAGVVVASAANTMALLAASGNAGKALRVNAAGNAMELSHSVGVRQIKQTTANGPIDINPIATVATISITTTGGLIFLLGKCQAHVDDASAPGTDFAWLFIYRDGVLIGVTEQNAALYQGSTAHTIAPLSTMYIDDQPAGTYSYTLQAEGDQTDSEAFAVIFIAMELGVEALS